MCDKEFKEHHWCKLQYNTHIGVLDMLKKHIKYLKTTNNKYYYIDLFSSTTHEEIMDFLYNNFNDKYGFKFFFNDYTHPKVIEYV